MFATLPFTMTTTKSAIRASRARRATLAAGFAALSILACHAPAADPLAEGMAAYARGDYTRAVGHLLPLAQAGNAEAQVRIGTMYYRGLGVREDDSAAFAWFRRAATQGNAHGQRQLADMYVLGHGVPPEELEEADRSAARWYFESAQQDNAEAQYALGILFYSGKGVVQSPEEALKWFRRAAKNGHADAQRFLGTYKETR